MRQFNIYSSRGSGQNPFGFFGPILILVIVLFAFYYMIKGLFTLLSIIAPVLLIATLILDRQVIFDYFKFLGKMLKNETLVGVLAVVLSIIGWQVVSGVLFGKALRRRSCTKMVQNAEEKQNTFTDYEIIEEEVEEDFLTLPDQEVIIKKSKSDNDYNDLFK